ncbi:hypothetical protein ACFQ45_17275 [Rhodanobacter aciditrophus]|uniref:CD-NTase associated protein 4-like DNA endonuclease domain-containing protein n=1 Tax=Rhodanobacter aciditrophus TaxID=1623218 RepID=A0ABW4B5G6_9GAMM
MSTRKKAANSGIDALLGFEFQRNCALYLLLNEYNRFKGREFFLCIEHHDDFLFCYRSDCRSKIEEVHSYQAKKLSGSVWTIDKRFSEVIAKMLDVGNELINDPAPKCQSYTHELTFVSNTDIKLNYKPTDQEKKVGKKEITYLLNEQNCKSSYGAIPIDIKDKINQKVDSFCNKEKLTYHKAELDNLHMQWVDFPRKKNEQKDALVGLMCRKFSHVSDPLAAVELLLSLFREVEAIYNQGKVITLLDSTKRVEGDEIKQAIDIIETEQKTFKLWRDYSTALSRKFRVPVGVQNNHESYIRNTFELLKDMNNNEHQIIKSFVRENDYSMNYYSNEDMFEAYVDDIKVKNSMNLKDIDIFFSTLCAFVECHGKAL